MAVPSSQWGEICFEGTLFTIINVLHKTLDRLLGWIQWLILTLLPILDHSHKGWVQQSEKVPLQISLKHSGPFLAFLVNF